jgi:hypothetical protein
MRKSRVEILRGKLRRMGETSELHPEMPDEVAESFLAELRFDPNVGAIAARSWRPDHPTEQPWIKGMLDDDRRRRASSKPLRPLTVIDATEGPVN